MHQRFGLIGKSLGHSFSPQYFGGKFLREGIDASYEAFELPELSGFSALLKKYKDLRGLNVTMPYKQAVIPFLDELDGAAAVLGAVNTIAISSSGKLKGFNTDVIGFEIALRAAWGAKPLQQAIVLGTGGSSKSVQHVLKFHLGMKRPLIVSRKPAPGQIGYEDLGMLRAEDFDVVINTTPLGMSPAIDEAPIFPYDIFGKEHLAFDLVYNPLETKFLKQAREADAKTENGIRMLHEQAEASWEIWQGRKY